jgi:hypothetical protein
MTQFIYDFCLLYKIIDSIISNVIDMQTDYTLYEIIEAFTKQKDETIKSAKILTKDKKQLTSNNLLKFNETRIERLNSNEIIYFRQETHIQDIQLMKSIESFTINAREKVRVNLTFRKQYIAQRTRD